MDQSFLFNSLDFMGETALFNQEQRGIYITLLCRQHIKGGISEVDMKNICGTHLGAMIAEFEKNSDGLYFNRKLDVEINKRKNFTESRRQNRLATPSDEYTAKEEKRTSTVEAPQEQPVSPTYVQLPINLPFTSPEFISAWERWKRYKQIRHRDEFRSPKAEQVELNALAKLAKGIESEAIAIIRQSITKGWIGFHSPNTSLAGVLRQLVPDRVHDPPAKRR